MVIASFFLGPRVRRSRRKFGGNASEMEVDSGGHLMVLPSGIIASVMRKDKGSPLAWLYSDL